jgi:hypothetical protein
VIEGGPRLHGRDRALRRITELRRRAAEGVGGVVLVTGEAGMGKTALCDALLVDAKRDGWRVAWTAAAQASILPGLWPWRQLLGALDGGDLPGHPSDRGDPAAARIAQFDAVVRRVRESATAAPVLAVLDDARRRRRACRPHEGEPAVRHRDRPPPRRPPTPRARRTARAARDHGDDRRTGDPPACWLP